MDIHDIAFSLYSALAGKQDLSNASDETRAALGRAVGRLGEPVIRAAVSQAMKILGKQFVFGRTIDEAMKRAIASSHHESSPQTIRFFRP